MLKINGAWYLDSQPLNIIVEREDGSLGMFYLNPFRQIKETDIRPYKGVHPRRCKGQPVPLYLYKFYELEKSNETASEIIHIRMTPIEKDKIESLAKENNKNVSEFVRDWLREL